MKCPKCGGEVVPWYWMGDGGYKGIQCSACGQNWWAQSLVRKLHEEIDPIVKREEARVLEESSFPEDAETEEERTERVKARLREREGGVKG